MANDKLVMGVITIAAIVGAVYLIKKKGWLKADGDGSFENFNPAKRRGRMNSWQGRRAKRVNRFSRKKAM